ncbi:MAG TPA: DoxX family protein [Chitinophagaceae bacterium]|nr:DoxX family protein [Chitinophagaceae bacterium]
MKLPTILAWALRLVAAIIMLQTLYFKFTGHEQSVRLFTELGMEPWGRIGTGVFELIASALILYPRTTGWGAGLGAGLMAGALFFHLTKLGIKFDGDYGLFTLAVIAFVCCLLLLIMFRQQILGFVSSRPAMKANV